MTEQKHSPQKSSAHLVAPELAPALELIPDLDLSDEFIRGIRQLPPDAFSQGQPPLTELQQTVKCEEHFIPSLFGDHEVRFLLYTPAGQSTGLRPALLHIHGGGYVLGTPELNDRSNRNRAAELDCVILSVDYRLAPETAFPGALEDCYAALSWLYQHALELGVDPNRLAVGGESAGAGHAASLALYTRERGQIPLCLQLLDSPMLDDRTGSSHDPHPYCGEYVWTPERNRYGWKSLLGTEPGGADIPANAVPARAKDLAGLPPAFILIGSLDLFLEESIEYARRLTRAGVPTELHVIPGAFHAFGAAGEQAPQVKTALQLTDAALQRAWQQST